MQKSDLELDLPDLNLGATALAPQLLACNLCLQKGETVVKYPINEVEAYEGFEDKASHAHRGMTPRNEIMFGPAGYWYVYLCYGVHWLLNLVSGPAEYPSAVLIRGIGSYDGPGKLTKALNIDKSFNKERCDPVSGLWMERNSMLSEVQYDITPRIGVDSAGREWADKPLRFVIRN